MALYALHFPHILADFPNHSPWMDYAKYTDEGWYANAATRFTLAGHWYVPGDFNPAVALPVWPVLLGLVFHFTGVSLTAARVLDLAVFGMNLLLSYFVLRMYAPQWIALLGITMLAANPFLYAFGRLALLEPLLVCLMLLCWWLALRWGAQMGAAVAAMIGLLLCLMVLTKTTGLLLAPSVLFLLAYGCGFRLGPTLRSIGIAAGCAIALWCGWYFLLIRPQYRADYDYFFQANRWPQPVGLGGHVAAYWWALHGLLWVSPALCITAVAMLAIAAIQSMRGAGEKGEAHAFWKNPLVIASLLALAGYIFLIGVQDHPQPRYYAMTAYPLCFVVALAIGELVRGRALLPRLATAAGVLVIAAVCAAGTVRMLGYVRHPEYTLLRAATGLNRVIREDSAPNHLLLSVSGNELQLVTHLPAICDDYGSWRLAERLRVYRPGWYAAWNEIDDNTLAVLHRRYSLQETASFPAFDDPDRDVLILYRLEPIASRAGKANQKP